MKDGAVADADINLLMLAAATGSRRLTVKELRLVLEHIARAGFDPNATEQARGRLSGIIWRGQPLQGRDRLPPVEAHYLRHVVKQQEWPAHTSLADYVESIRAVLLDETSGVFTSRYADAWQLGVVRQSADLRGPGGFEWILVDYRIAIGHWVTAYQPRAGLQELRNPRRSNLRWVRRPRRTSE